MKKLAYFLSIMILFTAVSPAAMANVPEKNEEKPELTAEETARLDEIKVRVAVIKAMDFSSMSRDELRDVKKELRDLNKEAKQASGGIYLSVGAIIIILLVLILLTN